jgi:hypothetical protein
LKLKSKLKKEFQLNYNNSNNTDHFVEFPTRHIYTRTVKTFEMRRRALDIYMNKLIDFYEGELPIDLIKFLKLNEKVQNKSEDDDDGDNDYDSNLIKDSSNEMMGSIKISNIQSIGIREIKVKNLISENLLKNDIVTTGVINAFFNNQ